MTTTCSEWRCRRPANGDDGLCSPHRAGRKRSADIRAKRNAQSDENQRVAALREAMREYVRRWREQHSEQAYTRAWECPLCGQQVQSTLAEAGVEHSHFPARGALEAHQAAHGDAWAEYHAQGRG